MFIQLNQVNTKIFFKDSLKVFFGSKENGEGGQKVTKLKENNFSFFLTFSDLIARVSINIFPMIFICISSLSTTATIITLSLP